MRRFIGYRPGGIVPVAGLAVIAVAACVGKSAGQAPTAKRDAAASVAVPAANPKAEPKPDSEPEVARDRSAKLADTAGPTAGSTVGSTVGSTEHEEASLIETGDIVFARCASKHARALGAVMGGEVNHVGIAFATAKGPQVLAAEEIVAQIPYAQWLRRCQPSRVVIKRLHDADTRLGPERLLPLQRFSLSAHRRSYDFAFDWDDDEALYSSEYVRKAFAEGPAVALGQMQTLAHLGVTAAALEAHNRDHSTDVSMQTEVVSPSSMMTDEHLSTVFDSAP